MPKGHTSSDSTTAQQADDQWQSVDVSVPSKGTGMQSAATYQGALLMSRVVVVPFWQIFLSRNGCPVNVVSTAVTLILQHSGISARTISKLRYTRNLANWFSGQEAKLSVG